MYEDYLVHYGVLGMKWGRRTRNGIMKNQVTAKRQIEADTAGLKRLNSGEHAHYGINSKRQSKYDERDKKYLEGRIQATKSMAAVIEAKKELKKAYSEASNLASRDTSEISKHAKEVKRIEDATYNYVKARIKAKTDLQMTPELRARAEKNQYIRAVAKVGLPNSIGDQNNKGLSSRLVNDLVTSKGKEYADSVIKGASNRIIGRAVTALAMGGAIIVSSLLKDG